MKTKILNTLSAVILFLMPNIQFGQVPNLGTTSSFALFTAAGAFNNLGASTVVTGDVGTNVGAFNAFPPGTLIGQKHVADAVSAQAAADVLVAYMFLAGIPCGSVIGTTLGSGQILLPNVYCLGAASTINGDLILDGGGDPNSVFIFKIDGALSTSTFSNVILVNGASSCNVFWRINGAVALGKNSVFRGTIVAEGAISLLQSASLFGRGLSTAGAISLQDNIVNVTIKPTASIITANGAITFCAGSSVILSGNVGGIWNNGATTASITVSASGDFFVTNTTSCGSTISNHIKVTVNPLPSCTISGNGIICNGQSTQLCAPSGIGYSYYWSICAPTRCIVVKTAGTYSVTVTKTGCPNVCSKIITVNPTPSCNITGSSSVCIGSTISLCAPSGYSAYLWSNGATTNCITVNSGGIYALTVTSSNGCSSTCSKTIIAYPKPSCNITGNLHPSKGESTSLCAPSGLIYVWNTGANSRCITVTSSGTYALTVSNYSGCSSTCSVNVTYYSSDLSSRESSTSNTSQHPSGNMEVNVYPNPFHSKTIMEFQNTESNSHVLIELYNLTGRKITTLFNKDVEQGVMNNTEINGENLNEGIYIYRIVNGDQIINGKLILVR